MLQAFLTLLSCAQLRAKIVPPCPLVVEFVHCFIARWTRHGVLYVIVLTKTRRGYQIVVLGLGAWKKCHMLCIAWHSEVLELKASR